MLLHVCGIDIDEDGKITDKPDFSAIGISTQRLPLPVEDVLKKDLFIGLASGGIAPAMQPGTIAGEKRLVGFRSRPGTPMEVLEGGLKPRQLESTSGGVSCSGTIQIGRATCCRCRQQTILDQPVNADQKWFTRKGGSATVGRIAPSHGTDRQHLPQGKPRGPHPVDE